MTIGIHHPSRQKRYTTRLSQNPRHPASCTPQSQRPLQRHERRPNVLIVLPAVSAPSSQMAQGHRKSLSAGSLISLSARRLSASRPQVPLLLDLGGPTLSPRTAESNLLSPEVLSPRSISLASSNTIPTTVTSDTELSEAAIPSTTVPGEQKDRTAIVVWPPSSR